MLLFAIGTFSSRVPGLLHTRCKTSMRSQTAYSSPTLTIPMGIAGKRGLI